MPHVKSLWQNSISCELKGPVPVNHDVVTPPVSRYKSHNTTFMLQEAKVIKNACMALASIVEARGELVATNCLISFVLFD